MRHRQVGYAHRPQAATRQHGEHQLVAAVLRSDSMNDKLPNDWLEAIIVTVCLVAIAGGALAMYDLAQRV
jgi:hypothetical protein